MVKSETSSSISEYMIDDLHALIHKQGKMEKEIADYFNLSLVYPFLDEKVIQFAHQLPFDKKLFQDHEGNITRKKFLREFGGYLGFPQSMTSQQKKAIQYGSGTVKLLRKIAKRKGYKNIRSWYKSEF